MHRSIRRVVSFALALALALPAWGTPALAGDWPVDVPKLVVPAERLAGPDRFAAATAIAERTYPGWAGVDHVVVASGDDRAAADPLAAASLCWAYDAPLLLVSAKATPASTKAALAAIASANPTVTVHVVGGTVSVPSRRVSEMRACVPSGTVEQPWKTHGRYALAAAIAERVRTVAASEGRSIPEAAIVANGADSRKFADALAASPISRATGIPILLTAATSVPAETVLALNAAAATQTVVVGGTATVSSAVYTKVGGDVRWAGATRYDTAAAIARGAVGAGWLDGTVVGLAAALPDALSGAGLVGRQRGVLLVTGTARLEAAPYYYLVSPPVGPTSAYVFGGPKSVSDDQLAELSGAPGRPRLDPDRPPRYVGKTFTVSGTAGSNTTTVTLYVAGANRGSVAVKPFQSFSFSGVSMPADKVSVEVRSANPDDKTCSVTCTVNKLKFPYATCIVIDKSDFRLYWVKDNELIKAYPIATGRPGMETPVATWKILAKYKTDPSSVYGPRKMRMFRKVGSSYVFTAYAIHGTNQEWVIGTKASHGCIRMYNRDVLELFPQVPIGTMVVTRP